MRDRWIATAIAVSLLAASATTTSAKGLDVNALPQSCQSTLGQIQADKPRFASLGRAMTQARKASDTNAFCMSARQIVVIIKNQSGALDQCVGELASGNVPQAAANQMLDLKSIYRQMLEAAKNEKNDRFHCGLADQ